MKRRSYFICTVLAAGSFSLTSCYDPYHTGRLSVTSSSYQPGYVVRTLPQGYRTMVVDNTRYYHHDGVYYQSRGSSYEVVEHPEPRRVQVLDRDRDSDRFSDRYRDRDRDRYSDRDRDRYSDRDRIPDGYKRYERTSTSRVEYPDSRQVYERDRVGVPDRYDPRLRSREEVQEVQVIRQLPSNHRVVRHRGVSYYRVGSTYYREQQGNYFLVPAPY